MEPFFDLVVLSFRGRLLRLVASTSSFSFFPSSRFWLEPSSSPPLSCLAQFPSHFSLVVSTPLVPTGLPQVSSLLAICVDSTATASPYPLLFLRLSASQHCLLTSSPVLTIFPSYPRNLPPTFIRSDGESRCFKRLAPSQIPASPIST